MGSRGGGPLEQESRSEPFRYEPNRGYGPLRFGMIPAEARAVLGEPASFRSPFEGIPLPDDMTADHAGIMCMEFLGTRADHRFPQLTFDADRLTTITLFAAGGPFPFDGTDLFARDRHATLAWLAAGGDRYFHNGESFLFPVRGLELPRAGSARKLPYLSLVDATYAMGRLEAGGYEVSSILG